MFNGNETYKSPEKPIVKLDRMMEGIAQRLNAELIESGESPLLEKDNSINIEFFREVDFDIKNDKDKIQKMETEWSGANIPNVQEYYRDKFGVEGAEEITKKYIENKNKDTNALVERAITGVLHNILKSEFLVMRSCVYDDYFNGFDNVIVNKETGDVICAFDEVHDEEDKRYQAKKLEKIKKISQRGGATLKYGVTFKKDESTGEKKLIKKTIKNIPVFYLSLSNSELNGLLSGMNFDIDGKASREELAVFDKLLLSLDEQAKILEKEKIPFGVRENLTKSKNLFQQMKKLRLRNE